MRLPRDYHKNPYLIPQNLYIYHYWPIYQLLSCDNVDILASSWTQMLHIFNLASSGALSIWKIHTGAPVLVRSARWSKSLKWVVWHSDWSCGCRVAIAWKVHRTYGSLSCVLWNLHSIAWKSYRIEVFPTAIRIGDSWQSHGIRISEITTGNKLQILGKSHTHTNIA